MIPDSLRQAVDDIETMDPAALDSVISDLCEMAQRGESAKEHGFAEMLLAGATARREGYSASVVIERELDLLEKVREARLHAEARHAMPRKRTIYFENKNGRLRR